MCEGLVMGTDGPGRDEVGTMSREITLTQGKVAIVDEADYGWLAKYRWCAAKLSDQFYAMRSAFLEGSTPKKKVSLYMAREILNVPDGMMVDHISGETLDNRRCNLRVCTRGQNTRNCRGQI